MEIYAKSALDLKQLWCKQYIGCDGIEIQLLHELVSRLKGDLLSYDGKIDVTKFNGFPIKVIHAPILPHDGVHDTVLEDYLDDYFYLLDQTCAIAEAFSKDGAMIKVVLHSESSYYPLYSNKALWYRVLQLFGYLLFKYPHTELLIENLTPIRNSTTPIVLCNNFMFDNVKIVTKLCEELNTDRIGTVLDICHAKISIEYISAFNKLLHNHEEDITLEDYFRANEDIVKLIHLADKRDSGYGDGNHGVVPDKKEMEQFVNLYTKYSYDCPVTLEIYEDDYSTSKNYAEALELLSDVLSDFIS